MEAASGEQLSRAASQALPHLHLSPGTLGQYPGLSRLLLALNQRLDQTGLSLHLKREMDLVYVDLRQCRRQWLVAHTLERTVEELLDQHHAARADQTPTPEDKQFVGVLERCWVLGRCHRGLDVQGAVCDPEHPPLLSLGKRHLNQLNPTNVEQQAMRERLIIELEERLAAQCLDLMSYVWPQYETESRSRRLTRCRTLQDWIQTQEQHLNSLREQSLTNRLVLRRQSIICLTVLNHISELLHTLAETHYLTQRPLLDHSLKDYLQLKAQALVTKLGLLRLELQHEAFNQDVVGAHQAIRQELSHALSTEEIRRSKLQGQVDLYQLLGPEFEELAQEYSRLLNLVEHRCWVLREFSPTVNPHQDSPGQG
ncbi:HAUS augmin-like complex subunit 4 [Narcine bancroftii]|uniref:HAUS augmin-like complex subunit 4 n=1 Tax=Narcine bancroftii TaxID=1343680 RepID=UPI003831CD53